MHGLVHEMFFPLMSTLTWDTFLTLRGTWGFYLNHVIPHRASKSYRVVVGWVAHKILVSAPVPLELILTGFDWVGAGPWGFGDLGRGLTIFDLRTFYFEARGCLRMFEKL